MKKIIRIIIIVLISIIAVTLASLVAIKCLTYSCADSEALDSTASVKLTDSEDYIFFDGKGTDYALVFYPGGFVEYTSYSALLKEIASRGIDCFLIKSPLNFALADIDAAEDIVDDYDYENVYVGGHSLGGVVACMFAEDEDDIDGIILLASYSSVDLSKRNLKIISVYGSNDGVLNTKKYSASKSNLPSDYSELIINGGNHCQFGNYGFQKGDGQATIKADTQRIITADYISNILGL